MCLLRESEGTYLLTVYINVWSTSLGTVCLCKSVDICHVSSGCHVNVLFKCLADRVGLNTRHACNMHARTNRLRKCVTAWTLGNNGQNNNILPIIALLCPMTVNASATNNSLGTFCLKEVYRQRKSLSDDLFSFVMTELLNLKGAPCFLRIVLIRLRFEKGFSSRVIFRCTRQFKKYDHAENNIPFTDQYINT